MYILAFSGIIFPVVFNNAELSNAIQSSLGVTGLALFLTTVIATARRSLSIFHVLCIFHLLGIAGFAVRPRGKYPTSVARSVVFLLFYGVVSSGSLIYLIYVFATAPSFGESPRCNESVVYVLFGVNISATNPVLRWLLVAVFSIMLLWLSIWLLIVSCTSIDAMLRGTRTLMRQNSNQPEKQGRNIPIAIGYLAGTAYLVAMVELMIKRNNLESGAQFWTFGQVLAMAMLIGPLIELVSMLLGKLDDGDSPEGNTQQSVLFRRGMYHV